MTNRGLAILGACATLLLALALFDPWRGASEAPSSRVLDAEILEAPDRIRLEVGADFVVEVALEEGHYRVTEPVAGAASDAAIRQLLGAARLLRATRSAALAAEQGLEEPAARVIFSGPEGEQRMRIGAERAGKRWVARERRADLAEAYLVEAYLVEEILLAGKELVDRRVMPLAIAADAPLRIERGPEWILLEKQRLHWPLAPEGVAAHPGARLELFKAFDALHFAEPGPRPIASEQCQTSLSVVQGAIRSEIRECGPCQGTQIRLAVGERVGCVEASSYQAVLSALSEPETLADWHLLPRPRPTGPFVIECGAQRLEVDPARVDQARLWKWWRALDGASRSFKPRIAPTSARAPRCSLRGTDFALEIIETENLLLARRDAEGLWRVLDAEAEALLGADPDRFRKLELITEEALYATRIAVESPKGSALLRRGESTEDWRSGDSPAAASQRKLLELRAPLASLRAESFTERSGGAYPIRIDIDFGSPISEQSRRYRVELDGERSACFARVDSSANAQLSAETCAALFDALGNGLGL